MKIKTVLFVMLLSFISLPCIALTTADFFKNSKFDAIKISPTGDYIAATVPIVDRTLLVIIRISDMKTMGVFKPEKEWYVDNFTWSSDKRVIFNTTLKIGRLEMPYQMLGIWAMDIDGSNVKKFSDMRWVLNTLPDDEDNVLMVGYNSNGHSIYGLQNTYTGKFTPTKQASPPSVKAGFDGQGYYANRNGDVLIHVAGRSGTDQSIYYSRTTVNDPWVQIFDEGTLGGSLSFMGFSAGSKLVYFTLEDPVSGPDSLVSIDMVSHELKTVQRDDNVNPIMPMSSPIDGTVYAIVYLDGIPRFEYLVA